MAVLPPGPIPYHCNSVPQDEPGTWDGNSYRHRIEASHPRVYFNMAANFSQSTTDLEEHANYHKDFFESLDALRRQEKFCDAVVSVKGKQFKAHRVVLAAASPFFQSLWESNMIEGNEQLIEIKLEEATASAMEDVLQFIYTGNVSVTEESCHELIATADYLLLRGLKSLASDVLKRKVAINNCVSNYYFADKYQCSKLKRKCCWFIKSLFSAVMTTEGFLNLNMKQVMEWVCSDDIEVRNEEDIFTGIVKWVSHNKSERESCFPDLLCQVRLGSISRYFLRETIAKEELVISNNTCLNFVLTSIIAPDKRLCKLPRTCLQTCTEGIFVCGGRRAMCYRPETNLFYHMANLMFEHQHHAVIQYREKVYIFSKQTVADEESEEDQEANYFEQSHVAEYYVPSKNSWGSIQTNFQYNDQFSSLVLLNDHSFLYALTNDKTLRENTVFAYDPDQNTWKLLDTSRSQWGACCVAVGHHLYIIGGSGNADSIATGITKVERFDPKDNNSHGEVAPLNEARHDAFGAAMGDKIYVAGGIQMREQRCRLLNTCEVYDPSTNEWQMIASLQVPRHSASMVCYKGALYVIGGLKNTNNQSSARELSVEMFDTERSEWKEQTAIPVGSERTEDRSKQIHYKACFATVDKDLLLSVNTINV